jgi:hypothetical protein
MNTDLTEEEMRRALFGSPAPAPQVPAPIAPLPTPEVAPVQPTKPQSEKKPAKAFTLRLRVTMRVGNEFERKTYELIHEADTLSPFWPNKKR